MGILASAFRTDGPLFCADSFQLWVELIRLFAPVSWCLRFENRFVASLENIVSGHRQWPTQTVSSCGLGLHLAKIFLHAREVQIHKLRRCHCRSLFQIAVLNSLRHGALLADRRERKLLRWLQENSEHFMMFKKRSRWFHSSRVKFLLVKMSASWFWVSTCLAWISLLHSFVVFKNVPTETHLENCVRFGNMVHMRQLINVSVSLLLGFGFVSSQAVSCCSMG